MKLVALAYARAALAALDLAQDLSRRAARLADAAPKLRAKGKTGAIEALLADDAVSAAAPIAGLSDRARRRLFDRLVSLKCSGAQSKCGGRAIKGDFRRKLAETEGPLWRTLFETEHTLCETDARS